MAPIKDRDLLSVQEVRNLVALAKEAQKCLASMNQAKIDSIVAAVADAAFRNSEKMAKMAHEETGFGKWEDKTLKNVFASRNVYESIKDLRTVGIVRADSGRGIFEVAVPVGVVAGLIPSTNPTSTVIFKTLVALKAGNAVVFSPHPSARGCIQETVRIMAEAVCSAGGPEGIVSCMTLVAREGTEELMRHRDVALILATGGSDMVRAAYSSGTPAIGVGPGNTPAFIEQSADIALAVRRIISSKTFDYSTICASEQSVVVESCIETLVKKEFQKQGGYFLSPEEATRVASVIFNSSGGMTPRTVGRSPEVIAKMAGISLPSGTKVLLAEQMGIGKDYPFSHEKLCPVLAFYSADGWEKCCEQCIELLAFEGAGHTLAIHSSNEEIIKEFGLRKPVSRVIVNAGSSLGAVGATTNLLPSMTLGCGAVGHNATSDNVGPLHLLNIRRVARGVREIEDFCPVNPSSPSDSFGEREMDLLVDRIVNELTARLKI